MGLFFYNLFLLLYTAGIHVASIGNRKARMWISGRKVFPAFEHSGQTIWMHCASLGEFEQGRPLLEKLKSKYPASKIVLTFFSPSGYEIRKNYPGADEVFYLPIDGKENAEKFINLVKPDLVLWVKYEYWYYYLANLKNKNIPVILISGIFRESQPFFKWYGKIWIQMLHSFQHLFLQDENSLELLKELKLTDNFSVSGDTRFDRVIDIRENFKPLPEIVNFCGNSKVLVAGSTWLEDETELIHYVRLHPEIKFIIAPHEVDKENIIDLKKEFPASILFSSLDDTQKIPAKINVLIIDNIGMLSRLYNYAHVTYVGGGFNSSGIHNVLEAAVYGHPVIFGPEYKKFSEAKGLVACGGAFSINNAPALEKLLNMLLTNSDKLAESSLAAKEFVYANRGATQKIMDYIEEKRLLIK